MAWHNDDAINWGPVIAALKTAANKLAARENLCTVDATAFLSALIGQHDTDAPCDKADPQPQLCVFALRLFVDAVESFSATRALAIFQQEDLPDLIRRATVFESLTDESCPLYSLSELAHHASSFHQFLTLHEEFLVRTGLPPRHFSDCPWLHVQLGRLYDTRRTSRAYPYDQTFPNRRDVDQRPPYQWVKTQWKGGPNKLSDFKTCEYEDADFLPGMERVDVDRIEKDRNRIFHVKVVLVRLLGDTSSWRDNPDRLWGATVSELCERFNADDIGFYLRLDRFYLGSVRAGDPGTWSPERSPGGLTNLLEVVGRFEAECRFRTFGQVRESIGEKLEAVVRQAKTMPNVPSWPYFCVLQRPDRGSIDAALDSFESTMRGEGTFWVEFQARVRSAFENRLRVVVPIELMPKHVTLVGSMLQYWADSAQAKIDSGDLVLAPPAEKSIFRKDGESWTIRFEGKWLPRVASEGLAYIAILMRRPGRSVTAPDLRALRRAEKVGRLAGGDVEPGSLFPQSPDLGDIVDDRALREYEEGLLRLRAELSAAETAGRAEHAAELQRDIALIEAELGKSRNPSGRLKKMSSNFKRDRDAVTNDINRAVEDLAKAHPSLGEHFNKSLTTGSEFCYKPSPPVDWEL